MVEIRLVSYNKRKCMHYVYGYFPVSMNEGRAKTAMKFTHECTSINFSWTHLNILLQKLVVRAPKLIIPTVPVNLHSLITVLNVYITSIPWIDAFVILNYSTI